MARFEPQQLSVPIVSAPMAGGISTPQLAAAVASAGGLGMLAAGYLDVATMARLIEQTRRRTPERFGINIFVPEAHPAHPEALAGFASALSVVIGEQPPIPDPSDDHYSAKIDWLLQHPVPVVSFTFGLPAAKVVTALQDAGSYVMLTVATVAEARLAAALLPDGIVVQSAAAGGHRATLDQYATPTEQPLTSLVAEAAAALPDDIALIAAGGLSSATEVHAVLKAGATAAQLGTLFLTCPEAGTKPHYRQALLAADRDTVITRAFTGRLARGLNNAFIEAMGPHEIPGYPQVGAMTIRHRLSGDVEAMSLWAGTGYRACREIPAAELVAALAPPG